jgi:hypothetical protein
MQFLEKILTSRFPEKSGKNTVTPRFPKNEKIQSCPEKVMLLKKAETYSHAPVS